MGDDTPEGNAVLQTTLRSGRSSIGSPEVLATPEPLGPRKPGQSAGAPRSATAIAVSARTKTQLARQGRISPPAARRPDRQGQGVCRYGTQTTGIAAPRSTFSAVDPKRSCSISDLWRP